MDTDTIERAEPGTEASDDSLRVTFDLKSVTFRLPKKLIKELKRRAEERPAGRIATSQLIRDILTDDMRRYNEEKKARRKKMT